MPPWYGDTFPEDSWMTFALEVYVSEAERA
jgi:hypothetical protein